MTTSSDAPRWVCEFCHETFYGDTLPHEWDWVFQSAVCPACIPRVKADGGYAVVLGGAYAGNRPDPRDHDLAPAVDEAERIIGGSHD